MSHVAPTYAVNLNPAGLPENKEFKYERVEKTKVDASGHAQVVDVREDVGGEDPGMNFKDKRPDVPPGVPIGVVPSAVTESGTAPEIPKNMPGAFIPEDEHSVGHDAHIAGHLPNEGHTLKKTEVREKFSDNADTISSASSISGSTISRASKQEVANERSPSKKVEVHEKVSSTSNDDDTASMRSGASIGRAFQQASIHASRQPDKDAIPTGRTDPEYRARTDEKVPDDQREFRHMQEKVDPDAGNESHRLTQKKFDDATPEESRV